MFRGRAGSWSGAYTVYSIFQGPGRFLINGVYRRLENPGLWAKSVYSKIQGPGQVPGPERIQKARKAWAESVYSNFQGQSKLSVDSVYRKLEEPGLGRICILKNSVPGQVPGLERIQKARKARAEPVYSKIQGLVRFLVRNVYRKFEKSGPGPGRLSIWSVYNILEKPGYGQNLYTQIFRVWSGSRSGAYTRYSKKLALGRISILKFSGAGQAPDLGRIQKAREVRAQIDSCSLTYTAYSKSQDPGEPDSYHIEYTALALHYKHQSSAQTRKRKPIVSTRRV